MTKPARPCIRCGAKSRRNAGAPCKNFVVTGSTRCRLHNGHGVGKPNQARLVHGQRSKFVSIDTIPEIVANAQKLKTPAGREELLAVAAATTEAKLKQIPEGENFLPLYLQARHSIKQHVETLHTFDVERIAALEQPLPTFTIVTGSAVETFAARGIDGICTVRLIEGTPWILDDSGAVMHRAVRLLDDGPDGSGAEYYAIEQHQLTDGTDRH